MSPAIYYAELNITCIVILLLFWDQLKNRTGQSSAARMVFYRLIWTTVALCIADMLSWCLDGQKFWGSRILIEIFNLLSYEALAVISYLWMVYVSIRLQSSAELDRKKRILRVLPLIAFTLFAASNPFTHILFSIDENNVYSRNYGIYFYWLVTWTYLLVPTVQIVLALAREKSKMKRREIAPLLYFIIAPAVTSIVQMLFYGISASQVGVTISIVMVCQAVQSTQVLTDALTGLNNRRALDNYLADHMQHREGSELTVLMLDINGFKQVNDKYGHMTGDHALQDVADALRRACREIPGRLFLCRFGGDEFVIAGLLSGKNGVAMAKAMIHGELEKKMRECERPYSLTVSIGAAAGMCLDADDAAHLLRVADEAMYDDKKRMNQGG